VTATLVNLSRIQPRTGVQWRFTQCTDELAPCLIGAIRAFDPDLSTVGFDDSPHCTQADPCSRDELVTTDPKIVFENVRQIVGWNPSASIRHLNPNAIGIVEQR
jgi:hypothetical protein